MVRDDNKVLLLNRQHDDFKGYIAPGGKVDFPESFTQSAIREVKEETGLDVSDVELKIVYEYVNPTKSERYIIFHYITNTFTGTLHEGGKEGKPQWFQIEELEHLPMQPSFRRRLPYFFKEGVTEMHIVWNDAKDVEDEIQIKFM